MSKVIKISYQNKKYKIKKPNTFKELKESCLKRFENDLTDLDIFSYTDSDK